MIIFLPEVCHLSFGGIGVRTDAITRRNTLQSEGTTNVSASRLLLGGDMIAWLNLMLLIVAMVLTLVFYVRSVGPAALEQKIGPSFGQAYEDYRRRTPAFIPWRRHSETRS
jgi:steroid 5-alpha reductase family enzyme